MADYRARLNRLEEAVLPLRQPLVIWREQGQTADQAVAKYAAARRVPIAEVQSHPIYLIGWQPGPDA